MPSKLKKIEKIPSEIKLNKIKDKIGILNKKTKQITYKRLHLAEEQLKTAIVLFLTNEDKLSSITLAGAADVILCELVNREGRENFTDLLSARENGKRDRKEIGNEINNLLHINSLKHFDRNDQEYVELDINECAVASILKALANYNMLEEKNDKLIVAFRHWVRTNLDPKKYNLEMES